MILPADEYKHTEVHLAENRNIVFSLNDSEASWTNPQK